MGIGMGTKWNKNPKGDKNGNKVGTKWETRTPKWDKNGNKVGTRTPKEQSGNKNLKVGQEWKQSGNKVGTQSGTRMGTKRAQSGNKNSKVVSVCELTFYEDEKDLCCKVLETFR